MSYEGVMRLARDPDVVADYGWRKVDWLQVTKACYDEAISLKGESFSGSTIAGKVGWFPGLSKLRRYKIVTRNDELSDKRETWWVMPDLDGTAKALRELGYL